VPAQVVVDGGERSARHAVMKPQLLREKGAGDWIGQNGHLAGVETAALIVVGATAFVSVVVVLWLFVWAARKDGEYDRAVQRRLGIRRRTRLGR
jgi:hypothetical protein